METQGQLDVRLVCSPLILNAKKTSLSRLHVSLVIYRRPWIYIVKTYVHCGNGNRICDKNKFQCHWHWRPFTIKLLKFAERKRVWITESLDHTEHLCVWQTTGSQFALNWPIWSELLLGCNCFLDGLDFCTNYRTVWKAVKDKPWQNIGRRRHQMFNWQLVQWL